MEFRTLPVLVVVIISCVITYLSCQNNGNSVQTTYNESGIKTVIAYCQRKIDCNILIGEKCGESGYSIVNEDHFDQKTVITAACGTSK